MLKPGNQNKNDYNSLYACLELCKNTHYISPVACVLILIPLSINLEWDSRKYYFKIGRSHPVFLFRTVYTVLLGGDIVYSISL